MQCNCGAHTKTKVQPKVKNKKVVSIAELDVCVACGRNAGSVRLYLVDKHGNKTRLLRS